MRHQCCTEAVIAHVTGPQLDLPHNVTPANLETLLNGLLHQTDKQPYTFYVEEEQLSDELGLFLQAKKVFYCLCTCP